MIQSYESDEFKDRDGNVVIVSTTLFPGSTGVEIFSKVFLLAIPIILPAMDTEDKKQMDFTKISSAIATNLSDKKVVALVLDIVKFTEVRILDGKQDVIQQPLGKKATFDNIIAGNYILLMHLIKYVLEVNFKDFFGENGIMDFMEMIPGIVKK